MNLEAPKEAPKLDPGQQAVNIIIEAGKAGNLTLLNAIKEAFPTIESKSEKNMENIRKFAIENNISPNVILALLYTEKSTTDKTSKAIETNITPPTTVIESQTPGMFEKGFQQVGKLESNPMTGAILDFTGSMTKQQIQAMIITMRNLSQKGIITEKTIFNVMYDISDQDDEGPDSKITKEKMKDTDQKLTAIEFGKDGAGLKAYLMSKGLINDKREVQKNGIGSTPLYTTILDNLMHSTVKDVTIFTDGASDRSANQKIGPEEVGNEESRLAMVNLCKTYNKKINIVAFNLQPAYIARTNAMKSYFEKNNAAKYITIIDLGKQNDATLSKILIDKISNNYEIVIKEDQTNMVGGKKVMTIDTNKNTTPPNILEKQKITNETVRFVYDETNGTYEGNLGQVFPGVDLSQYTIDYTINSSAKVEQNEMYPDMTNISNTYIIDISGSMGDTPSNMFKQENLSVNPIISYASLLNMKESILGFRKGKSGTNNANKLIIGKFENGDGILKNINADFSKPNNNLYGLVIKAGIDFYDNLLKKNQNNKAYMDEKTKLQNALLKIYNNTIDAEVGHLYQKILLNVKDKQEEIKGIYSYIQTLESIKGQSFTPILETVGKFGDKQNGDNANFFAQYKGKTINFLTDFGENSSDENNGMKKAFDDVQSSVLPKYNYAVRALETAKKLNRKNNKNIEELEKNLINAKNNLYKKFNNNAFIKNLQKNLEDNSTKIVFRYFKKNEPYYGFLKVLGDYINSKNTNNADNKKLFDFKKVEGSTNNNLLSMLYKKEYSQTPSTYERNSITWKLTSKTNPQNILTQTIGIVTKDLLAKK